MMMIKQLLEIGSPIIFTILQDDIFIRTGINNYVNSSDLLRSIPRVYCCSPLLKFNPGHLIKDLFSKNNLISPFNLSSTQHCNMLPRLLND